LKKAQEAGIADAQSLSKMGALQMALRARNSDLADLLLSMGVDPNGRTGGWALPIEWVIATYPDGDSYLQKAMDAGMSPCLKTSSDDSLLVSAANAGKVAYLLQLQDIIQSSSPEEMGKILIGLVKSDEVPAAKFIQIMDKMIAQGLKPAAVKDSKGRNLLMALAGSRCEPKLVEYLVRNGVSAADTNEDGKSTADQAYLTASQDIFGKYTKYSCDTPELSRVTNACVRQISMLTQNGSDFSYDPVFNRNCKTSNYQVASVRIQIPLNRSDSSQGYSTQPSYNPYPSQARRQQPTHQSQRSDDDDGDSEMKAPGIVTNRDGSVEINGVKFGGQSGCTETVTIINGNVNRSKVCN
jgi:ankyrin repeat protein